MEILSVRVGLQRPPDANVRADPGRFRAFIRDSLNEID
jgi:hypothetical protein